MFGKITRKEFLLDGCVVCHLGSKIIKDEESYELAKKIQKEKNDRWERNKNISDNFPQIPTEVALKKAHDDYKKEFGIKERIKRWFKKGVKKWKLRM